MKITRKTGKKVLINQIELGQTFIEDDEIFLMCRYEGGDICCPRCDASITISDEVAYFAVMLSSGEIFIFSPYDEVMLVECEVIER